MAAGSKPAWGKKGVPGQPELHSETLAQKDKTKTKKTHPTIHWFRVFNEIVLSVFVRDVQL